MPRFRSKVFAIAGGLLTLSLITSCSGAGSAGATGQGTAGAKGGVVLKVSDFGYDIPTLEDAILKQIAVKHPELGVSDVQSVTVAQPAAWAGASRGDIDLMTEVALPDNQAALDANAKTMTKATKIYGPADQGWYVPKYAVSAGGAAAGLTSVSQLNNFKNVFNSQIISGDPAWNATQDDHKRVVGYGLDYTLVESSDAARLAEMDKLYKAKKPFIIYLYHPSWVFSQYDMVKLKESAPFSAACFAAGGSGKCAQPVYTSWIIARKDIKERAPKFWAVLQRIHIPIPAIEKMEDEVDVKKRPVDDVVPEWMGANKTLVNSWITG